jgi:hypothetical protein
VLVPIKFVVTPSFSADYWLNHAGLSLLISNSGLGLFQDVVRTVPRIAP